jgi:small subunit ribosomal protein S6
LQQQITEKGGTIKKVHDWGRRRFAYPIEGKREGHYYLLYFTCPSLAMKELWREYSLNEDLIRFMTVQTENVMETIEFKPLAPQGGQAFEMGGRRA